MSEYKYYLNAGIDFGTSYTKVYVEDQFTGLRKPVLFGEKKIALLPSYVRCHQKMVLGPLVDGEGIAVPYLKLLLADEACGKSEFESLYRVDGVDLPSAPVLVTGFFASLLTSVTEFLRKDPDWKDFSLERDLLTTQVAVPTGMHGNDSKIDALILECLKAGSQIARSGGNDLTYTAIEERLESLKILAKEESAFLDHSCKHYPEVAAAVQAMLRSGDLPEGKYITMDVGAGTVDMNFFYKRGTNEDQDDASIDTWVAKVVPLGCACLGEPHEGAEEHERTGIGMDEESMRIRLSEEIRNMMQRVFVLQPRRVAGNGPDVFHHGVHAYIFGGGANVPIYEETLKQTLDDLDVRVSQIMRLPTPRIDFVLPRGVDDFGRLAVAYGISAALENLETARLPDEMDGVLRRALEESRNNQNDGEMACSCYSTPDCARCSGTGYIRAGRLRTNLEAIELWNLKREIDFSKGKKPEFFAALPEVASLNKYIENLTVLVSRRWMTSGYVVIKRMEYLQRIIPSKHCPHILKDSADLIEKVFDSGAEEEVEIDFASLVEIEDGFEADLTFSGPKGTRPKRRFQCICKKLPSKNQGGLITKCYASVINNKGFAALFVRVSEEDEPMPSFDDELKHYKNVLSSFTRNG